MEFGRRAPKYFSQAWKNLLPAQSAKKEVANGDKAKPKQKLKTKTKLLTSKTKLRGDYNYDNESKSN